MTPLPVKVKILGTEYSVTGYDDPEYLHEIADLVNERMQYISRVQTHLPLHKNAILTALNLADELVRTRRQLQACEENSVEYNRKVADRARSLAALCAEELADATDGNQHVHE